VVAAEIHMMFMRMMRKMELNAVRLFARAVGFFSVIWLIADCTHPARKRESKTARKPEVNVSEDIS
jgi:hypothetical protein